MKKREIMLIEKRDDDDDDDGVILSIFFVDEKVLINFLSLATVLFCGDFASFTQKKIVITSFANLFYLKISAFPTFSSFVLIKAGLCFSFFSLSQLTSKINEKRNCLPIATDSISLKLEIDCD
jgi:hypothetical protein